MNALRRFLKSLGGRVGNASRSKGRIGSRANKRAAHKAERSFQDFLEEDYARHPWDYDIPHLDEEPH